MVFQHLSEGPLLELSGGCGMGQRARISTWFIVAWGRCFGNEVEKIQLVPRTTNPEAVRFALVEKSASRCWSRHPISGEAEA